MNRLVSLAVASGALLALGESAAFAQTQVPFSNTDSSPTCSATTGGTVCTFSFPAATANHRREITNVNCRNNLLNPETSRENVTLNVEGAPTRIFPLLPENPPNSNIWVVSDDVFVPVNAGQHVEITIQSFGGAVVAGAGVCSI